MVESSQSLNSVPAETPQLFINRELSWLEFNRRVLLESAECATPILERLKFLTIYFNNLDEFFMVRVGSLNDQENATPERLDDKSGMTAQEQISAVFERVREQKKTAEKCWHDIVEELSKRAGISILDPEKISATEEEFIKKYFDEEIKILLSPLIIDRHHPFPFLRNKEEYVISLLEGKNGKTLVGIIPLSILPQLKIFENDGEKKIVFSSSVVAHYAQKIFKEHKVRETAIFRVTRNADIAIDESLLEDGIDFRGVMQEMLKKRKRLQAVRLQIFRKCAPELIEAICKPLEISAAECIIENVPLSFAFGFSLPTKLGAIGKKLSAGTLAPTVTADFRGNAAEYLREHDLLLAYPFQSIKPFVRFLEEAADDPDVVSIKITLYRMCSHSKIALALARAAENGKDVFCVLELRARFDEQNNIDYAEMLQRAGCTVAYGLPQLKVHAKLCLVTYRTPTGTSTITQIGTGNYNEKTSELYTDLCYITADSATGRDAAKIFNGLGIGIPPKNMECLWAAPTSFLSNVIAEIDKEIIAQKNGEDAQITVKVNGLNNTELMNKLVEASRAGVKIELFVRGICCLRPQIPGWTENITVRSVVGTFLEHSRIFAFGKNERERIFIGSGDFMNRNLVRRVEVFTEIRGNALRMQVLRILEAIRNDNLKSWEMLPDGFYRKPSEDTKHLEKTDSQMVLRKYFSEMRIDIPKNSTAQKDSVPAEAKGGFFARLFGLNKNV